MYIVDINKGSNVVPGALEIPWSMSKVKLTQSEAERYREEELDAYKVRLREVSQGD